MMWDWMAREHEHVKALPHALSISQLQMCLSLAVFGSMSGCAALQHVKRARFRDLDFVTPWLTGSAFARFVGYHEL